MTVLLSFLRNVRKYINKYSISFLLNSIRAFIIEFLQYGHPYRTFKKRKNGISVLIPTQNEELMVNLSILSFLDFADEIIVVDNGSIDKTKRIIKELVNKYSKIKFFDKPDLPDLYHNRQFSLRQSQYRWICRFDSDFVAYTNGEYNILELRKLLLKMPKGLIPKVIALPHVKLGGDFWHVKIYDHMLNKKVSVIRKPMMRVYEYFPFFTFSRFGRREYGAFQIFMKKFVINKIHFMHCTIKSDLSHFLRSERSNWREYGNFKKYPNLLSYIKDIMKEKYNTTSIKEAYKIFLKNEIYNKNHYIEYDPDKYLPYPSLITEEMKKENVFKIAKYF
jgi:glycosyltransferase involved in cell wall biosynthesis